MSLNWCRRRAAFVGPGLALALALVLLGAVPAARAQDNAPEASGAVAALHGEVRRLARERRAVLLALNYQVPEVQDVADFVGDSLGLSQQAAATDAGTIVFCGVHFMAETASILSPGKTVLLRRLVEVFTLSSERAAA